MICGTVILHSFQANDVAALFVHEIKLSLINDSDGWNFIQFSFDYLCLTPDSTDFHLDWSLTILIPS